MTKSVTIMGGHFDGKVLDIPQGQKSIRLLERFAPTSISDKPEATIEIGHTDYSVVALAGSSQKYFVGVPTDADGDWIMERLLCEYRKRGQK